MTLFWIYVVIQLVSTAYGITVINSVKKVPALKKKLKNAGYTPRDKDSLYRTNEFFKYFFKGFIPFYYAYKALQLINDDDPLEAAFRDEIDSGNYITDKDKELFAAEEESAKDSIAFDPHMFDYDDVETYKARPIDLNKIYDDDETPEEYITREADNEHIQITPFVTAEENKPKNENLEVKIINNEVTNSDIANAIAKLSEEELEALSKKLISLAEIKKTQELLYKKDVA